MLAPYNDEVAAQAAIDRLLAKRPDGESVAAFLTRVADTWKEPRTPKIKMVTFTNVFGKSVTQPATTKWPPAIGERYVGKWPPAFRNRG